MSDKEFQTLYDTANMGGRVFALSKMGEGTDRYPCGFAWVLVRPSNCAFANWLKKTDKGSYDSYRKAVSIWISDHDQSADHKALHAIKMAQVFQVSGLDAEAGTRLD